MQNHHIKILPEIKKTAPSLLQGSLPLQGVRASFANQTQPNADVFTKPFMEVGCYDY